MDPREQLDEVPTPALDSILARDAMHAPVVEVTPATPLPEVASLMASKRIHAVVVDGITKVGPDNVLVWGVVSDRDVVRAALAGELDVPAGAAADTEAVTVGVDDDLDAVARILDDKGCSHAVVLDRERRPAGVISTLDIASVLGR